MLHALWYEDQGIQLLKFSMSQEVKKGPLAALTFESSKNFILTYFQKLMWFHLLATKDSLLGKVWGKLFSDAKYLGPLLQRSPLNCFWGLIFSLFKKRWLFFFHNIKLWALKELAHIEIFIFWNNLNGWKGPKHLIGYRENTRKQLLITKWTSPIISISIGFWSGDPSIYS